MRDEYGPEFYREIGRRGGETMRDEYGPEFYQEIGRRGGEKAFYVDYILQTKHDSLKNALTEKSINNFCTVFQG